MGRRLGRIGAALILFGGLAVSPVGAAEPRTVPAKKPTVKLKANFIVFDRGKGDLRLEGEVRVTRTIGGQVMTVHCDKMTAKMKDNQMQTVHATGNVKVTSQDVTATSTTAEFDFAKNIIKLYGEKGKPATMTTAGMRSTGPTIIFFLDSQQMKMPDGGETELILKPSAGARTPK